MKKIFDTIDRPVGWFCKTVIFLSFIAIIVSAAIQVFGRFILEATFSWTDELCRYGMVWMTFIGAGYAVRSHGHIAVDLLKSFLPVKASAGIEKFNDICEIVFGGVLAWYGFKLAAMNITQLTPGLKISMGAVYSCIPIGGVIICAYALMNFLCWTPPTPAKAVEEKGET